MRRRIVIPARLRLAALIVVVLVTACGEDQEPLGPEPREPSFTLVSNGGCPPEVITTRQGDTETLLFTFGVPQECMFLSDFLLRAEIDGSPYGVDFGDWDDPESNVAYLAEQDFNGTHNYLNLPSPPNLGKAYDTSVYQSYIEFDPPVRSVEFYYSRQRDDAAWWGGQFVAATDSMQVRAMSSGFFVLDAVTLYSNSEPGMVDTWDSTQLTTSLGDLISWVWFYGRVYIDDLKITRAASPTIDCDTVVRAQVTTCDITLAVDQVHGWEFTGTFPGPSGTATVLSSSSSTSWSGQAVLSGTVTAEVSMNGVPDTVTLFGNLEVLDRNWSWDSSVFDYDSAAGKDCGNWGTVYYTDDSLRLGRNTRTTNCDGGLYDPSIYSYPDSGYSAAPILDGGPNDSLWYVTESYYFMDRGAILNPFITPSGVRDTMTNNRDKNDCKNSALGTIVVNFYEFNKFCRGDSLNLDSFYQGVHDHEGYGTGAMNGHQIRNEDAAVDSANDPHTGAERMVQGSAALLRSVLSIEIQNRDMNAFAFGVDHNYVNNNWCGSVWVLKPNSKYFFSPITMAGGVCF